jgi:hypothetical protein
MTVREMCILGKEKGVKDAATLSYKHFSKELFPRPQLKNFSSLPIYTVT